MFSQAYITETNNTATVAELVAVLQKTMAAAGFDCLMFSLLTDHETIGRKPGLVVASGFMQDWLAKYFAAGFYPMQQQIYASHGAFSWKKFGKGLFEEGPATGLYHGVGIPLWGPLGAVACVVAAGSVDDIVLDDNILDTLECIASQFYKAFLRREATPDFLEKVQLTCLEMQALTLHKLGKRNEEIAESLKISPRLARLYLDMTFLKIKHHKTRSKRLK